MPSAGCDSSSFMNTMLGYINTSIEHVANFIQPNQDIKIKDIKDLAAGGVLIVALTSLIVGMIIFLPKIIALFG